MDLRFQEATRADDPELRRLLRENPMPGGLVLTYEREPDYFLGCDTLGSPCQVITARQAETGRLAGVLCRSVRRLYVNGEATDVGYISQLRIAPEYQGRWLLLRGGRLWQGLHADGRVRAYLCTITEENREARGVLVEHPRRYLPAVREVDRVATLALILRRRGGGAAGAGGLPPVAGVGGSPAVAGVGGLPPGWTVRWATPRDLGDIVAFLGRHGPEKQFFPAYTEADFAGGDLLRSFRPEDFVTVRSASGEVAACMGLWDQSGYKQTVVRGYRGWLRQARPLYNALARVTGLQPLPEPGLPIRNVYGSFICVAGNSPDIFRVMLRAACAEAARRGYGYLTLGLTARDPLLPAARRFLHIPYYSRLYTVCWEDGVGFHEGLDHRIPYVEIAAL